MLLSTDPVERSEDDLDVGRMYNPATGQFRVVSNTSLGVARDVQADLSHLDRPRTATGKYHEALTYVLADYAKGETN